MLGVWQINRFKNIPHTLYLLRNHAGHYRSAKELQSEPIYLLLIIICYIY